MKSLFIIRHGKAEPREGKKAHSDADRQLTAEGAREMEQCGRALGRLAHVEVVLTSPLSRAFQTAKRIAAGMRPPPKLVELEELAPIQDLLRVVELINRRKEESIAIVGHEPDMSRLASFLLTGRQAMRVDFKKGAICRIDLAQAGPGAGTLAWFAPPRIMRAMGRP